jgi:hypothetical protein
VNLAETMTSIAETAGVELPELPLVATVAWFPVKSPIEVSLLLQLLAASAGTGETEEDRRKLAVERERERETLFAEMRPTMFRVGQICPLNRNMSVLAIFEDEDEGRIYALQTIQLPIRPDGSIPPAIPPTLYRLSKGTPVFSAIPMKMDVLESEIAKELQAVFQASLPYGYDEAYENERFRAITARILPKETLEKIEEELEAELDEDEDDEDKKETPVAAPGTGTPPAPPPSAVKPAATSATV